MYNKRIYVLMMLMFNVVLMVIVAITSFKIGQRDGAFRQKIQRIPFDISTFVQVYKMNEYIHNSAEAKPIRFDVGVWLYGLLNEFDSFHEKNYFNNISSNSLIQINEARRIIANHNFLDLSDYLIDALDAASIDIHPDARIKEHGINP